jgi:uncharacterized protein YdcH (DUF465 family)
VGQLESEIYYAASHPNNFTSLKFARLKTQKITEKDNLSEGLSSPEE